jgi:antitoxin (DNA-binding transcriptional repressor) of toxin-antitoxin stability system
MHLGHIHAQRDVIRDLAVEIVCPCLDKLPGVMYNIGQSEGTQIRLWKERAMPKTIDVQEAQSRLKELLSQELPEGELVLTEDNKPIARVIPISSRVAGLHTGAIWTSDDFDEPLPDGFWTDNG